MSFLIKLTQGARGGKLLRSPALILTVAGLLAMGGWSAADAGENLPLGLALIALSALLGVTGLALLGQDKTVAAPAPSKRAAGWLLALLCGLHLCAAVYLLRANPAQSDCFLFLEESSARLLQGVQPYGADHKNIYDAAHSAEYYGPGIVVGDRVREGLPYPPLSFLAAIPGHWLGDVRLGFALALLLSALLLYRMRPGWPALALAALVLLNPLSFFVEMSCWTEPLVWLLLCVVLYARERRPGLAPVALGLLIASKQYNILALPLAWLLLKEFSWKAYGKLIGGALLTALCTLAPFWLWDSRALWHDLVWFHIHQPFRRDAVSFAVLNPALGKVGLALLLLFLAWISLRVRRGAAAFSAAYALALLLVFAFSKQAFCNYYYLIAYALLAAAVLCARPKPPSATRT